MGAQKPLVVNVAFPCTLGTPAYGASQPYVANSAAKAAYVDALTAELNSQDEEVLLQPVQALRLSGGASIMNADKVCRLVRRIRKQLTMEPHAQIGIEVNPLTVGTPSLSDWTSCGVNRVHLDVLSVIDDELLAMGAQYRRDQVQNALLFLEKFHMNNLDALLMFGLPGQTRGSWRESLEAMATTGCAHITVRPLVEAREEKRAELPGADEKRGFYDLARETLGKEGYQEYLVGSFVRSDAPHMRDAFVLGQQAGCDVLGLGAGASTRFDGFIYQNNGDFDTYVKHAADFQLIVCNAMQEGADLAQARRAQGMLDQFAPFSAAELARACAAEKLADAAAAWLDAQVDAGKVERTSEGAYALTETGRYARLEELGAQVRL